MDTIRLVSWNVNGFRALSGKPDWDWFASTDADVVALQETKAEPAQIAEEHRSPEGWNAEWLAAQVAGSRQGQRSGWQTGQYRAAPRVTAGINEAWGDPMPPREQTTADADRADRSR